MSDQPDDTQPDEPASGIGWGDPISDARKAELQAYLDAGNADGADDAARNPPFQRVALTGADVFWLAEQVRQPSGGVPDLRLDGADLREAQLEGADLREASLQGADLMLAHLERAHLNGAHLERALLISAVLQGAHLNGAHLERASLSDAHLEQAHLREAHLEQAGLHEAHLEEAVLRKAHLDGAILGKAHLEHAFLREAQLEGANLSQAQLEGADLREAHLIGANFSGAHLAGADLREAFCDTASTLRDASTSDAQHGSFRIADTRWGGVNLATLKGPLKPPLGDEQAARAWKPAALRVKPGGAGPTRAQQRAHRREQHAERLSLYRDAVRANRQFAVALQDQGMSEEATRFAYQAQVLQRRVYRLEGPRSWGRAFFSSFLDLLAGFGYKPGRSLLWYLAVIFAFATANYLLGPASGHTFQPDGALVFSITSFHGRGFFPGGLDLENWITRLAALEAMIGLLIEISFIATFTQRYFGAK